MPGAPPVGRVRSSAVVLILIAAVGTFLSLAAFAVLSHRESAKINAEFERDKSRRARAVEQRLRFDAIAVYPVSRFVNGAQAGGVSSFQRIAEEVMQTRSDVTGI